MLLGIIAGLGAGALWGLTFIAPNLVAPFSPFDLAFLRNLIFAGVSIVLLYAFRDHLRRLAWSSIWIAMALGVSGYSAYYIALAYAVKFAGPAIPALIIGSLPVLLAIVGNRRERTVAWNRLVLPLGLITLGLAVVNIGSMSAPSAGRTPAEIGIGAILASVALVFWVWYGVKNAATLKSVSGIDTTVWTCLQGIGAGLGLLAVFPVAQALGFSRIGAIALTGEAAMPLWLWAFLTGALSSWLATYAWVYASRRLSLALCAQLIVSETLFGLFYGFLVEQRWPDSHELLGAGILFTGVFIGIHVLSRPSTLQVQGT